MSWRLYYIFMPLFFVLLTNRAQAQEKKILQFSGLISSVGGNLSVPYVTVTNLSRHKNVYMANHEGYFSFVAHPGDSILFSSVGYDPFTFVIPNLEEDKYTAHITMNSLVIELPAATPYPWASVEEFNLAFMALNLGEDDLLAAKRNLSPQALAELARIVPRSAGEIQSANNQVRHNIMNNKVINQKYANPLFSPLAWGNLINSIVRGDYSRDRLKY